MIVCPSCGRENPDDARFCSGCATELVAQAAVREERKVVTVLFCDLVGSTARAEGADPEDVRALLSAYHERVRSELERFGGTVEKFIGDAVMALFGAPTAHEDDPERAVRAALAIRDWAAEEGDLQVRIGITTGEALVTLSANPQAGEGMASGDVVNTAARLQSGAPENGILVDETTYRATERVIDYAEDPAVEAKGKAEPVPVWRALEARSRVRVEREEKAPLVGREQELGVLVAALDRVRQEGEPQLVTLVGVPGIGKSRLVYELFKSIESGGELTYWRHGRSLPYGQGVSFWALSEMVKAQAGILESDAAEQAAEKLRQAILALTADDADWIEMHLKPLVGLGAEHSLAGAAQLEAFAAWRRFLELLAEGRPLVLIFEDLHWADDSLLDFVDYLVEWASGAPVLVVCTARPELLTRRPAWGGGKPNSTTVSLASLSGAETATLLGSLLGRSVLPAETQAALLERAGGNPLYAEEFARLVLERADAGEDGSVALPESVQGIIAARLDALPVDEKALLQDAAVLGRAFWVGALVDETGDRGTVERLLHGLARKEFVRRERRSSVAGETEYTFRHVLIRDGAYGQIPRARRIVKHEQVAGWIEALAPDRSEDRAEMLAEHYLAALELTRATGQASGDLKDRAARALREAGDRAFALNAYPAAARYYDGAANLLPPDEPSRPEVLFRLAEAHHLAGDAAALERLEEAHAALNAAGLEGRLAEAEALLAELAWYRSDTDRVSVHLDRAESLAEKFPASREKARVLSQIARYRALGGAHAEAIRIGTEALTMARELDLRDVQAHALNNIGIARAGEGLAESLEDFRESANISLEARSPDAARALQNLAVTQWGMGGSLLAGRASLLEAIRVGEEFGLNPIVTYSRANFASLQIAAGEWDEGLELVDVLLAATERGQPTGMETRLLSRRATVRLLRGDDSGAIADVEQMMPLLTPDPQTRIICLGSAARVYALTGRIAEAKEVAGQVMSDTSGLRDWMLIDLAWVAETIGVADWVERQLADDPRGSPWGQAQLAMLRGDYAEAADVFAEMGEAVEEALARLHAAEALVTQGRRGAAEEQLQKALPFLRSLGATRYVSRGERLLAESA